MTVKTAALSTQDTADWKMFMKNFSKNITPIRIVVCIVFINKKVFFSANTNSNNVLQIFTNSPNLYDRMKIPKKFMNVFNYKWSNQLYYFTHMFEFKFYQIWNFSMICYQTCPTPIRFSYHCVIDMERLPTPPSPVPGGSFSSK